MIDTEPKDLMGVTCYRKVPSNSRRDQFAWVPLRIVGFHDRSDKKNKNGKPQQQYGRQQIKVIPIGGIGQWDIDLSTVVFSLEEARNNLVDIV